MYEAFCPGEVRQWRRDSLNDALSWYEKKVKDIFYLVFDWSIEVLTILRSVSVRIELLFCNGWLLWLVALNMRTWSAMNVEIWLWENIDIGSIRRLSCMKHTIQKKGVTQNGSILPTHEWDLNLSQARQKICSWKGWMCWQSAWLINRKNSVENRSGGGCSGRTPLR